MGQRYLKDLERLALIRNTKPEDRDLIRPVIKAYTKLIKEHYTTKSKYLKTKKLRDKYKKNYNKTNKELRVMKHCFNMLKNKWGFKR